MPTIINNSGQRFVPNWSGADMSTTITSDAYKCGDWTSTSVHVEWPATGAPVGTFSYEASNTSSNGIDGIFRPVSLTVDVQPNGEDGGDLVDFSSMPWTFIRVKYVPSSGGVGALPTVTFFSKGRAHT